jgi:hypothetical protein
MVRVFWASLSFVTLSLVAACSGKVAGADKGSGADGGPGPVSNTTDDNPSSGPQGSLVAACPSSKPTNGTSCTPIGQLCEYGDDVSSQCNYVAHCSPEGSWESVSGDACTTSFAACDSSAVTNASCNPGTKPCATATGVCTCFDHSMGPAQMDDGGVVPDPYGYACADPDPRCPAWPKRPRIGSACSSSDVLCDYSPCGAYGLAFRCDSGGFWSDAFSAQCGGG